MGTGFFSLGPGAGVLAIARPILRHLFKTGEYLAGQVASEHNLKFYQWLMAEARIQIEKDNFEHWKEDMLTKLDRRLR